MKSLGDRRRLGLAGGLVAFGVLLGASLVWAGSSADAQTRNAPDGPEKVFALTAIDRLLTFDGDNPGKVTGKDIKGLVAEESLVGIDFRAGGDPAVGDGVDGKLYGVGVRGYIYTINPNTARAERGPRITADLDGDGDVEPVPLVGDRFGIDFNPTVDRLRIVSEANQNLRVNVDTGALADFDPITPGTQPDGNLQYAAGDRNAGRNPAVTAAAYRNSRAAAFGTMNTELYDIDALTNDMSEQNPPNDGTLNTVGPLGVDNNQLTGFDIVTRGASPAGDRGYAALDLADRKVLSKFYKINLNSGKATSIGRIGNGNARIEGLAIPIGQR